MFRIDEIFRRCTDNGTDNRQFHSGGDPYHNLGVLVEVYVSQVVLCLCLLFLNKIRNIVAMPFMELV